MKMKGKGREGKGREGKGREEKGGKGKDISISMNMINGQYDRFGGGRLYIM
jgi:hypothetical protein